MKYHQIIYSKNSLFCGVGKRFKLYFMHKVMLSFDTLHVHVGKKRRNNELAWDCG